MRQPEIFIDDKTCKRIYDYFKGGKLGGAILLIVIGLALAVSGIANEGAIFLLFVGLAFVALGGFIIYKRVSLENTKGPQLVDETINQICEQIKEIGIEQLGLVSEDVEMVEPLVVCGPADPPAIIDTTGGKGVKLNGVNAFKNLFRKKKDREPVYMEKFGKDHKFRTSLVQITMFFCGEKQIYAYAVKADITLSYTYEYSMYELFYSDITGVDITTKKKKMLVKDGFFKKAHYIPLSFEKLNLMVPNFTIWANWVKYPNDEDMEAQLKGLRSLVRERKNA